MVKILSASKRSWERFFLGVAEKSIDYKSVCGVVLNLNIDQFLPLNAILKTIT